MIKRVIGALYGIFLEEPLSSLHNWQCRFEKEYLNYCRTGCRDCYKWNGYCRSRKEVPGSSWQDALIFFHALLGYNRSQMITCVIPLFSDIKICAIGYPRISYFPENHNSYSRLFHENRNSFNAVFYEICNSLKLYPCMPPVPDAF